MPCSTPGLADQIGVGETSKERRPVIGRLERCRDGEEGGDLVGCVDEAECFKLMEPGENDLVEEGLREERGVGEGLDVRVAIHCKATSIPGKVGPEDSN